jgi:hypothetical protein
MEQLHISLIATTPGMTQQYLFLAGQQLPLIYLKLVTRLNYKKILALDLQTLPLA